MEDKMIEYKNSHSVVKFNPQDFGTSILANKKKTSLVLAKSIYDEWASAVSSLSNPISGKELFQALIDNKGTTWALTGDETKLKRHYKKSIYGDYESNIENFKNTVLPTVNTLVKAIGVSTDSTDSNLPDNKEKVKKLYQKYVQEWYTAEHIGFSGVASDSPNVLISCNCLDVKSTEVTYEVISDSIKVNLLTEIKTYFQKQIGSKNDTAPWHDAASYGITILSNFYKKHYSGEEWKNYTPENIGTLQFPTNIARRMWNCNVPAANNKTDITLKLKLIFKKLLDLAFSFTKKYGPSFEFNIDDLIFEMKNQFTISNKINIDDLIDIESIYKNVDKRIITTQEFHNKLKVAIDNSITDSSVENYYTTVINQNISDTTNYDFVYQRLLDIELKLIKELTIIIEDKNKSKKKPIPGYKYTDKLRSIDVSLSLTANWSSNFELELVVQDRGTYYAVYLKKIGAHGVNSTKLDSFSFDFEPIKVFIVKKNGSVATREVQLGLTYKVTQALVAVNLSTEAVRQTILRALIGAKLKTPFTEILTETEVQEITTDPTFINGTMQTPTPITLTNYYTFDLNMSYNSNKKELEFFGSNAKLCDLDGKYTERTTFAPGESISFKKDLKPYKSKIEKVNSNKKDTTITKLK